MDIRNLESAEMIEYCRQWRFWYYVTKPSLYMKAKPLMPKVVNPKDIFRYMWE